MGEATAADPQRVVQQALSRVGDIATLPEVTLRIIELVDDPKSTAKDLHRVIRNDPALSAKILKVVNSAFYGLPGQVASVDRAIVLLGLSAVKNIAIAASISRMFRASSSAGGFNARDLWTHCIGVAVAGRRIGALAGTAGNGQDELFLAGLIHDLGLLVAREAFPEELAAVVARVESGDGEFLTLEREVIGADHQQVGAGLMLRWRFPRPLQAVGAYHHCPQRVGSDMRKLVSIISLADNLCCQEKIGLSLTCTDPVLDPAVMSFLGVSAEQMDELREALPEMVSEAESVLTG